MTTIDRFEGCLLGLALGDALGAPFEGGIVERAVWKALGIGKGQLLRWTDDTQMSLDVAESVAEKGAVDLDAIAQRFAASYRWSRGYGPGAARLLERIAAGDDWRQANRSIFPDGSFGNGAAMRAPAVGMVGCARLDEFRELSDGVASITHAHPLGIEGAFLIGRAAAAALLGQDAAAILEGLVEECRETPFREQLALVQEWHSAAVEPDSSRLRATLGNGVAASASCVSALHLALVHLERSFEELFCRVAELGGDVDTIAAMSGGIWGARRGVADLPAEGLESLEAVERLRAAARALHALCG